MQLQCQVTFLVKIVVDILQTDWASSEKYNNNTKTSEDININNNIDNINNNNNSIRNNCQYNDALLNNNTKKQNCWQH